MPKILMKTIGLMLVANLAFAPVSGAKEGRPRKSSHKTQKQAQQMHLKAIRKQDAKVQILNNRLNDFAQTIKISPSLQSGKRQDESTWNVVNKTINEHHKAKQELNTLTQTTYANYAAARGYTLKPYPPETAPPPLPPKKGLTVRFKEVRKDPKSKRPPGAPANKPRRDKY